MGKYDDPSETWWKGRAVSWQKWSRGGGEVGKEVVKVSGLAGTNQNNVMTEAEALSPHGVT